MRKFWLLSLFISLLSCDDEPASENQTYFTVTINPDVLTEESDDWIILHSGDGTFLDARAFESGDILTFSGHKPDKISVTRLNSQSLPSGQRDIWLETHLDETPNSQWTIQNWQPVTTGNPQGRFQVTVPLGEIDHVTRKPFLSDRNSPWGGSGYVQSGQDAILAKDISDNARNQLFIAADVNGNLRYKFFPDASPGTHSLSINDLQEFDVTSTISFPSCEKLGMLVQGL